MALKIQTKKFTCPTSTGTQDLTISNFGTVDAALFISCNNGGTGLGGGTWAGGAISIGYTDKTRNYSAGIMLQDAQGTTNTQRDTDDDHCIRLLNDNDVAIVGKYDSDCTDGITIDWTWEDITSGIEFYGIFFGGLENVYSGSAVINATQNSATSVTSPGFEPDIVFLTNIASSFLDPGSMQDHAMLSFGFAVNDTTHLKALYNFESGALTTDSVGSNTLSAGGTLYTGNAATAVTSGGSYRQDSAAGKFYYDASNPTYYRIANEDCDFPLRYGCAENEKTITICAWIKLGTGANECIFSKWHSSSPPSDNSFVFRVISSKLQLFCTHDQNNYTSADHLSTLSNHTWYHVTASYRDSDGQVALRVRDQNGEIVGTDIDKTLWSAATYHMNIPKWPFEIGAFRADADPDGVFDGYIDELVIFDKFLSADEVTAIAKGTTNTLCALYNFESGAFTTDSIGNNTLTAGAAASEETTDVKQGYCCAYFPSGGTNAYYYIDDVNWNGPLRTHGKRTSDIDTISVCTWFKTKDMSSYQMIFSKGILQYNQRTFCCWLHENRTFQITWGWSNGSQW